MNSDVWDHSRQVFQNPDRFLRTSANIANIQDGGQSFVVYWGPSPNAFIKFNLDPRVLRLFCQRSVLSLLRIFLEFFDWLLFCKQPIKTFNEYSKKFRYPRVSPGDQPLTKSRRKSGLEIDYKADTT